MITEEEFKELITDYQKWDKRIDEVSSILKSPDLYEADWISYTSKLFDNTLKLVFNKYAVDDISWWIWEKSFNPDLKMWDKDDNEIPTETIDDLWNIVKENRI